MLPNLARLLIFLWMGSLFAFPISKGVSKRNLLRLDRSAPYSLPKAKVGTVQTPDTVFIMAFRVEFQEDSASVTTGTGLFDSDTAYPNAYKYDPSPHDQKYFEKHLEFLQNYYWEVSDHRLWVEYAVYPNVPQGAYQVDKEMRDYNPWEQKPEESYCDFGMRKAENIMRFVEDAVAAADAAPEGSPFADARNNRHFDPARTSYLLIHAGASALGDGGFNQAIGGADTPSDFFDSFISQSDLRSFLDKDSLPVASRTLGVKDLMMVSETANQDSLNFGINGILANQFARQLGVPDLFGTSNCFGISAVGSFCLMDFAGYNGNARVLNDAGKGVPVIGFIPPYPSAWVRAFLGWTAPTVCAPGKDTAYTVFATQLDTTHEILQVPLNENEYLLIENRQRNPEGRPRRFIQDTIPDFDNAVVLGPPILDSLAVTDSQRRDIVVSAKNYDAVLPGSGLLVWHVDESVIRLYYELNGVNSDSSRRGISLIEADGVQDIGAQFTNIFGTMAQDYGQPADFFPHKATDEATITNRVPMIYTHDGSPAPVRIFNVAPVESGADTLLSEGHGKQDARRVINYRSNAFTLNVTWGAQSQGVWPALVDSGAAQNHLLAMDLQDSLPGKEILSVSKTGKIYAFAANGQPMGTITDSLPFVSAKGDTLSWTIRTALLDLNDALGTPAAQHDTVFFTGAQNLYRLYHRINDTLAIDSLSLNFHPVFGPILWNDTLLLGDAKGRIHVFSGFSQTATLDGQTQSPVTSLAADDLDKNGVPDFLVASQNGVLACFESGSLKWKKTFSGLRHPRLATGDLDRAAGDAHEIVLVDSQGVVYVLDANGETDASLFPVRVERANLSQPGLADLDQDGYLDIVISGSNRLFALDRRGNALAGWPMLLDNRSDFGQINCSPTLADADNNLNPDAIFSFGETEFLEVTRNAQGAIDSIHNGAYAIGQTTALNALGQVPADFPMSTSTPVVASLLLDDLDADSLLEVCGVSLGGWLYAAKLPASRAKANSVLWQGGMGNPARNPVYADSMLPPTPTPPTNPLSITEYYAYPNPVARKNSVHLRYALSRDANRVELFLYDASGAFLESHNDLTKNSSWNRYTLNIRNFGSGVYRAKLVAADGSNRQVRFVKFAVIR